MPFHWSHSEIQNVGNKLQSIPRRKGGHMSPGTPPVSPVLSWANQLGLYNCVMSSSAHSSHTPTGLNELTLWLMSPPVCVTACVCDLVCVWMTACVFVCVCVCMCVILCVWLCVCAWLHVCVHANDLTLDLAVDSAKHLNTNFCHLSGHPSSGFLYGLFSRCQSQVSSINTPDTEVSKLSLIPSRSLLFAHLLEAETFSDSSLLHHLLI